MCELCILRSELVLAEEEPVWRELGRSVVGIGAEEEPSVVEVTSSSEERKGDENVEGDLDAEAKVDARKDVEDLDSARVDLDGVPVRVSTARSVGGASCSYRQGLPMHPYFYEEGSGRWIQCRRI
ncbi:unnamed protein product [Prunus armeniaca]|uniref:Uncharacterized protein n=1 Tax=Prunus armeniaca TaxID=36596 RepID=A0A6J5XE14_PRUAR|nr:unnamed protein product [Prunus armeniaca]